MKKLITVFLFIGYIQSTQATLIDNGNFTTDTVAGFDWLDMSKTVGRSYLDVSSHFGEGGDFYGWRYATTFEVSGLVDGAGGNGFYYNWPVNNKQLQNVAVTNLLLDLMGKTFSNSSDYIYAMTSDIYMNNVDTRWLHLIQTTYPSIDNGYVSLNSSHSYTWWNSKNVGSFLVRKTATIPEPSIIILFGIALAGLSIIRINH